jgi:hypothetical protein
MDPANILNMLANMGPMGQAATNMLSTATEMMNTKSRLQKAIVGIPVSAVTLPKTYRVYVHPDGVIIKSARDLDLHEQLEYFAIDHLEFVFATVLSRGNVEVSSVSTNGYRVLLDCIKFDPEMKVFVYQYSYRKYVVEHGEVQDLPIKRITVPVIEVGEDRDSEAYVIKLFKIIPYTHSPIVPAPIAQPRRLVSQSDIFNHCIDVPNTDEQKCTTITEIVEEVFETKKLVFRYIYTRSIKPEPTGLSFQRHLEYESELPMLKQELILVFKSLAIQEDANAANLLELCEI